MQGFCHLRKNFEFDVTSPCKRERETKIRVSPREERERGRRLKKRRKEEEDRRRFPSLPPLLIGSRPIRPLCRRIRRRRARFPAAAPSLGSPFFPGRLPVVFVCSRRGTPPRRRATLSAPPERPAVAPEAPESRIAAAETLAGRRRRSRFPLSRLGRKNRPIPI